MINSTKICGLLGIATKAGKVVAGTDACLEKIKKGEIKLIIVAQDASDRTKDTFKQEAKKYNVEIYEVLSIDEISKAIGKVNKAVIGIKEIGLSNKIISIIIGGEEIGKN